jgi:hypothetical protein
MTSNQQVSAAVLDRIQRGDKIGAIKAHRDATGLGLREAKAFVDAVAAENGDAAGIRATRKAGDVSALGKKSSKALAANKRDDEEVVFCICGLNDQSIVALDDRLLVIKPGMVAGAAFGAKVTSFNYSDIRGVEVERHIMRAYIEISSAGFEARPKERDRYKEPNCIPVNSGSLNAFKPYLDQLSARISDAKKAPATTGAAANGLVGELAKLSALRDGGALTDEEFTAAKGKLLG